MSFVPRPCAHCHGARFQVVPGVQLEIWRSRGGGATAKAGNATRWNLTLVICSQCGRTETFTTNAAEMASLYPGSQEVTTSRTE